MATKRTRENGVKTTDYRHSQEHRTNIPPARIAGEGEVPRVPKVRYRYNPHLPPVLRFDPSGAADKLPELIAEAGRRPLKPEEQKLLAEALRHHQPWLEWAGKQEEHERGHFDVDPVALHIHERVSAQAIVRAAMREDVQRDLFADPEMPYHEQVQFYRHEMGWANRLILGDSLQVMASLARRENLSGKVQMIYIDPPYGIKFASNFQPEVGRREVKEQERDLTRESEVVRAYRDTWTLGTHSYLAYLRARFILAKELLNESGSVFVQIGEENVHVIRALMDEVFGEEQFLGQIAFTTTGGQSTDRLSNVFNFLLWYARSSAMARYRPLFDERELREGGGWAHSRAELEDGRRENVGVDAVRALLEGGSRIRPYSLTTLGSQGVTEAGSGPLDFEGRRFVLPQNSHWKTTSRGMEKLGEAGRIERSENSIRYVRFFDDFPVEPMVNIWDDTNRAGWLDAKRFVVQTSTKVVERCVLMTSDPGDLVLDPTCGSGTTALVAEQWGRRWITIDTSRVAVSIARQRLLTAKFDHYRTRENDAGGRPVPASGFKYKTVPHITLKSIAQSTNLDPIFAKHEPILDAALTACNDALKGVGKPLRDSLKAKLAAKQKAEGKKSVTDADRRRWVLPPDNRDREVKLTVDASIAGWYHWEVPFDTDPDWPKALQDAVTAYRKAWRAKMDEVNACIATNADQEELVDQPEKVSGVVRVSGPFTVEGVRPEELSLGEAGEIFDPTPNEFEDEEDELGSTLGDQQNLIAYLSKMLAHLKADGLTFLGNKRQKFGRLEPLFENQSGSLVHAEGTWDGEADDAPAHVAVGFGPQYGPVTAEQVEDLIRASVRYDELVVAGFSFAPEASTVVEQHQSKRLRIHKAFIRPDINPAMDGLLKDTANSQLFTVFGQPEVSATPTDDGEWVCSLEGVDIYDPLTNTVRSSGAEKVAAWFLDSDFDGRCFCTTQAFFPDQDAWEKIAKALGSTADADAFAAFKGTTSLPFKAGKHQRVAVKVIDPRGNEVMAIRSLK
jgi:adenine-specific DNA-methyltransferase